MTSELTYKDINDWVYRIDSKDDNYFPLEVEDVRKFGGEKYQILKTSDNTSNGMQAMQSRQLKMGRLIHQKL